MAKRIPSLEGLRNDVLKSIYGRRLGLDSNDQLVGPQGFRVPSDGWESDTTTFATTGTANLVNYGLSVIGTSITSASTAGTAGQQQLAAPQPGVVKYIANPTTGEVTIGTTAAAAFITGSNGVGPPAASTYQYLTIYGMSAATLIGLTTERWMLMDKPDTGSTQALSLL